MGITELTLEVRKYLGREMISEKWEIKREGGGVEMKEKKGREKMEWDSKNATQRKESEAERG